MRVIHNLVEADKLVAQRGVGLYGGELVATSGGTATVDIYDGLRAEGAPIMSFSVAASGIQRTFDPWPVQIHTGLYVNVGPYVSRFTIFYDPTGGE
jgi:hypothetical protein